MRTWELDLEARRFAHPDGMMCLLGLATGAGGLTLARFYDAVLVGEKRAVRSCLEAAVGGGARFSVSFHLLRPDGSTAAIAMAGRPRRSHAGGRRLAGIAFDIANICDAELEALRHVDVRKNDFIAAMAHELRNPLTAVLAAGELVAKSAPPEGGMIRVRIDAHGEWLRCTISDSGIGMAAEFVGRAFEPFVQAAAERASMHEGVGLGLKLVRELAEIHGGTVQAHSEGMGRGTTLVLELPLARPPGPQVG